ncbi:ABC transporter permease [Motilimonas sp. KMU-193]|uniref:ABC transporter permease n=1 Tax=Motilimonas sp. KMU-193 TaxID=3388668 RepID=UPI00396B2363
MSQHSIDIAWWQLGLFSLTLLIPFAINHYYRLQIGKEAIVALLRMTLQLVLIGAYLAFLFELNNLWLNLLWLGVMFLVGCSAIINKAKLPHKTVFVPVLSALAIALLPLLALLSIAIIQPTPYYDAQYLIPIAGMLLGNSMTANIVCLQHFFGAFEHRRSEYEGALALGATPQQACLGFVQSALQKALAPILATMATTGLVSLPGMMTGQILGGASPMVAIKYQLLIMVAIWVMMSISTSLCLAFLVRSCINRQGRLRVSFT